MGVGESERAAGNASVASRLLCLSLSLCLARIHSKQTNQNAMHVSNEWTLTQTLTAMATATASATLTPTRTACLPVSLLPTHTHLDYFDSDSEPRRTRLSRSQTLRSRMHSRRQPNGSTVGFELYNSPREQQQAQSSTGFRSVRTSLALQIANAN